jgi:hypothetical protein
MGFATGGHPGHCKGLRNRPFRRTPLDVKRTDKDLQIAPEHKTEHGGKRSPRVESYPDHRGKQGETGRRETATVIFATPKADVTSLSPAVPAT